jgi:hypothetical protein
MRANKLIISEIIDDVAIDMAVGSITSYDRTEFAESIKTLKTIWPETMDISNNKILIFDNQYN